jgi:hypothetical protein
MPLAVGAGECFLSVGTPDSARCIHLHKPPKRKKVLIHEGPRASCRLEKPCYAQVSAVFNHWLGPRRGAACCSPTDFIWLNTSIDVVPEGDNEGVGAFQSVPK